MLLALTATVSVIPAVAQADDDDEKNVPGAVSPEEAKQAGLKLFKAARARAEASCGATVNPKTGRADGPFGPVVFDVHISHKSGVAHVVRMDGAFEGTPTGQCVARIFDGVKLPPWKGPDVTGQYAVTIPTPKKS
jgi:hypothetical protein